MDRDLTVMALFLVITKEILNKFKRGERMTLQEKILFFTFFARTVESWQRLVKQNASLPQGYSEHQKTIENGDI